MTEPVETYDDGGALYEAGPFEVAAQPPGVNPGVVSIDGRNITPHTARLLARVLEAAADRAAAEQPADPDRDDEHEASTRMLERLADLADIDFPGPQVESNLRA